MNSPGYEFGPFRLDPRNRQLLRGADPIPLTPKVLDVLLVLVERHGQLVLKDDLLTAVWPNTHVSEANLTQAVFVLRKALGETGSSHSFISTVAGSGYRFTADVRMVSPAVASPLDAAEPPALAPDDSATNTVDLVEAESPARFWSAYPKHGLTVALALLLLIAVGGLVVRRDRGEAASSSGTGRILLAVLPFANLTGDAGQDYFADGLTEEMISQVGNVDPERLGVIARTSVMRYKERALPLSDVQRELGVQYVLEGSVRRDPEHVRITAQLIRVQDRSHVWSRNYDRELRNLLAVQADIARDVSTAISRALMRAPAPDGTTVSRPLSSEALEAYDLYLQGRYHLGKRTREDLAQAVTCFEQATARDPGYARAHAGLADAYVLMSNYGFGPAVELIPKARSAALRALEVDDTLAEAHAALALMSLSYDWDWRTAEKEYQRAAQLNPNYATTHHWYAELLAFEGRFAEAEAASARSKQLDPLSLIIAADHGAILYFSRQYDRAIAEFREVLAAQPGFPRATMIVFAYAQTGRFAEAFAETARWPREDPWTVAVEAYLHGRQGHAQAARTAVRRIEAAPEGGARDRSIMLAVAYSGINDKDAAIAALQRAFRDHSNLLVTLKVEPIFDPLRDDPRFRELVRMVGLQ
jgi:TolB-like protein/DNA-binding winged helix-turn-helix (wHTH) protein/Tfp pilus assembly protein PilF